MQRVRKFDHAWWDGETKFKSKEETLLMVGVDRIVHGFDTVAIQCKWCKRFLNPCRGSTCEVNKICSPDCPKREK